MRSAMALMMVAAAARAEDGRSDGPLMVSHVPVAEARSGRPLALTARVENDWKLEAMEARWRKPGRSWETSRFGKAADGSYVAVIERGEVQPPHLEYYLTVQERGGQPKDKIGTADLPHPVLVRASEEEQSQLDLLARHRGHTSRARTHGEYAMFGTVKAKDARGRELKYPDVWYQLELDYMYRILSAVSYIRLGVVRLRADVPPPDAFRSAPASGEPQRRSGMDYGYSEIALDVDESFGLYGKLILGADDLDFATGAGAMVRIGDETGARAELGFQAIQRVGYDGYLRMVLDTVPSWPMALAIHLTNTPAAPVGVDRNTDDGAPQGIRVLYDVGYEATENVTLMARIGYQARVAVAGGPTAGGGVQVEW